MTTGSRIAKGCRRIEQRDKLAIANAEDGVCRNQRLYQGVIAASRFCILQLCLVQYVYRDLEQVVASGLGCDFDSAFNRRLLADDDADDLAACIAQEF